MRNLADVIRFSRVNLVGLAERPEPVCQKCHRHPCMCRSRAQAFDLAKIEEEALATHDSPEAARERRIRLREAQALAFYVDHDPAGLQRWVREHFKD